MGLAILLIAACTRGGDRVPVATVAEEPHTEAIASPQRSPAPVGVAQAADPSTWGDQYWVILQSDRDATKVPPSLSRIAGHPDLGLTPQRLPSSRFKNLMPCFEVVVADAKADKAEAVALSKKLTALGVDNYVKSAGPYVGRRAAVDAWCGSKRSTAASGVWWAQPAGGVAWMLLQVDASVAAPARAGAPTPTMLDWQTWAAPLAADAVGRWNVGDAVTVVYDNGATTTCHLERFHDLTTGIAHFGVMQRDEAPEAPPCGEPQIAAELDCAVDRTAIVIPSGAVPTIAVLGATVADPAAARAASAVFEAMPGWSEAESWSGHTAVEAVTVRSVEAGGKSLWLAEATITEAGGCGAVDEAFFAVLDPAIPRTPLAGPVRATRGRVRAVIDLGRGPRLWIDGFPQRDDLVGPGGASDATLDQAYCDCAC